ncbi:carbohydrate kinase family protein [Pseudonocardia sp. CA-107938]|uniref:carbohydrate kinase family protein n=1 Tax=Pseudonocardia sp. CA-107938 TaxID=3240021 RepID=UPI003D93E40B
MLRDTDVLVVGDANPDLVLRGDVRPRFGQAEQWLTAADLVLAGSAGIVAAGLARLGVRTALAAHVGTDAFGDLVLARLAERGVDTRLVTRDPDVATGLSVILSTPQDRAILTHAAAITRLDPGLLTVDVLAGVRHVHVASFFLVPGLVRGTRALFERAHAVGATTSLDTNWDPDGTWAGVAEVLPVTDVLLPNTAELCALTGHADLDAAAAAVRAAGPLLAVKAGADGAHGWDADGRHDVPATPVEAVDTTGAGDSFDVGFLAGRLAGLPFVECLRRGATAGALSTRAAGGTAAQATAAELDAALS